MGQISLHSHRNHSRTNNFQFNWIWGVTIFLNLFWLSAESVVSLGSASTIVLTFSFAVAHFNWIFIYPIIFHEFFLGNYQKLSFERLLGTDLHLNTLQNRICTLNLFERCHFFKRRLLIIQKLWIYWKVMLDQANSYHNTSLTIPIVQNDTFIISLFAINCYSIFWTIDRIIGKWII